MAKTSKKTSKRVPAGKGKATAKAVETTPRKTWADDAKEPAKGKTVMDACIDLMRRPSGAGIADFQMIKGFNLPSMAVVRAAEKRGYKATAKKEVGSRTVYKATGSAK